MAQRIEIPMGRRVAETKSKYVSTQTLINCFLEVDPETNQVVAYGGPGLTSFASLTGQGVRGLLPFGEGLLAVSGTRFYVVTEAGVAADHGEVLGSDPVTMAENGEEAAICAAPEGFVWDGALLNPITDPDFPEASSVDYIDGYFAWSVKDSGAYVISDIFSGMDYDSVDIASAERRPDNLRRLIVDGTELLLFGMLSMEAVYNSGNADFPFERTQTFVEYGLAGPDAITRGDNTVYWLTDKYTIRCLRGGTAQEVSDDAINAIIAGWSNKALTRGYTIHFRGHEFVCFRHPDGCILIDTKTNGWMRRQSVNDVTWRVGAAVRVPAWGKTIVGDAVTGELYEIDDDAHDEDGEALIRYIASRTMGVNGNPFTVEGVEIEVEPGTGLTTGQGSDPKVWLEVSRDGGKTFGARLERSIGARGDTRKRITWGCLGQFPPHGAVIRLGCSDPVSLVVGRAWADVTTDQA